MGRHTVEWSRIPQQIRPPGTLPAHDIYAICHPNIGRNVCHSIPFLLVLTNKCSFMESIRWVDATYVQKHKSEDPDTLRAMYYPNLVRYSTHNSAGVSKPIPQAAMLFVRRYGRKVGMLLGMYLLSLLPVVGRFVMPAASFYTFKQNVGTTPAAVIFGTGVVLPKRFLVTFLHTYFASRSLMRELVST